MKARLFFLAVVFMAASCLVGDEFSDPRAFAEKVRKTLRPEILNADWLRERGNVKALSQAKAAAERVMDGTFSAVGVSTNFPRCEVDWCANPTPDAYQEWTWHFNRHGAMTALARYYTLTNDSRAVVTWMKLVRGWIAQMPPPPEGTHYGATKGWRSVDTGLRAAGWMWCIHAFIGAPELTDEFITLFYRSVRDHGRRLKSACSWGNWAFSELKGLTMVAVLSPFLEEASDWRRFAIGRLDDEMSIQVHPDGFHYELTTHYHKISESEVKDVVLFLRAYGIEPPPRFMGTLERMYEIYIKLMRPNRTLPSLNDGEEVSCKWRLYNGWQLFPNRMDFKWFFDPPGNAGGEMPKFLSCALPYSGAISMRSDWSTDAVWAYMDASPLGCHEHEDYLNVLLFAYGKDMIIDAGNYCYDSSAMRHYVLNTRAHNTAIFDGKMQNRNAEGADIRIPVFRKVPFSFATTPSVDWAEATYTNAYGDCTCRYQYHKQRDLWVRHSRKLVFFKSADRVGPFLVVIDRMGVENPVETHSYEIMWHLADCVISNSPNAFSADFGDGVGLGVFASDRSARFEDKIGQTKPMQGWIPDRTCQSGGRSHHPIHTPVLCGSFAGAKRVVTILCPFRRAACPIREVAASSSLADSSFSLLLADGRTIHFDESDLPPNMNLPERPSELVSADLRRVAESYLSRHPFQDEKYALWWNWATLWWGVSALGLSEPDSVYSDYVRKVGEHFKWGWHKADPVGYHADLLCIGQAYLEQALSGRIGADEIAGYRKMLDNIAFDAPATGDSLDWSEKRLRRWKWCDALFMAAPAFARMSSLTGDGRYRAFADSEFKATTDYLFNKEYSLYHRDSRYFGKKCANGKPMFWSRGNGWVFASIALMLRDMPESWPSRTYYLDLYHRMARAIRGCQTADGTWHSNLLSPDEDGGAPELSGTCLYLFGFLWGLNSGILSESEYGEVVDRAWGSVSATITPAGHLGFMQKMAAAPGATEKDNEEPYGVGAFLAAGVEMKTRRVIREMLKTKRMSVSNPSGRYLLRKDVEVELSADMVGKNIKVFDLRNGAFLPCVCCGNILKFTTYLPAGASRYFQIGIW